MCLIEVASKNGSAMKRLRHAIVEVTMYIQMMSRVETKGPYFQTPPEQESGSDHLFPVLYVERPRPPTCKAGFSETNGVTCYVCSGFWFGITIFSPQNTGTSALRQFPSKSHLETLVLAPHEILDTNAGSEYPTAKYIADNITAILHFLARKCGSLRLDLMSSGFHVKKL